MEKMTLKYRPTLEDCQIPLKIEIGKTCHPFLFTPYVFAPPPLLEQDFKVI